MKIEIRIAPVDQGQRMLAEGITRNTGRLRWVGVRHLNTQIPQLQRLHDAVLDSDGVPDATLLSQARTINAEVLEKAAALNVRTAVILIDLPPIDASAQLTQGDLWSSRIACLLQGIVDAHTTIHLCKDDPLRRAAIAWQAQDADASGDFTAFCQPYLDQARHLDQFNNSLMTAFPKASSVVRTAPLSLDAPRGWVLDFFRDIGVSPETLKIPAQPQRNPEEAAAIAALVHEQEPPGASAIIPPASQDAAAQLPLTIFFMVEPGPLEAQAHLLVASLAVHCRDLYRLVGFCRTERMADLHPQTVAFLRASGAELRGIENTFHDGYPAGNKLIAAASVDASGWALFLDTDICLVRDTSFLSVAVGDRVSLCLDNVVGWARDDSAFAVVAETLGFSQFPRKQALWGGAISHPTFNAGLVLFPPARRGQDDFGKRWMKNAMILEGAPAVTNTRPWLDTIALAGTVAKERNLRPLPLEWNCTTRMADETTRVLHYHGLRQIRQYGWQARVDAILAASHSPYNTLSEFMFAHKQLMGIEGDIERRAMRHGTLG